MFCAVISMLLLLLTQVPDGTPTVRLVDVDGNGAVDRVVLDPLLGLSVELHAGGRRFVSVPQPARQGAVVVTDMLARDLDGDGWLDLYLVTDGENLALRGDGTGRFVEATAALGLADGGVGLSVESPDVDGDGRQEVLLHGLDGDVLFWAEPDGTFRRDWATPQAATGLPDGLGKFLRRLKAHMSFVRLDDGQGGTNKTLLIEGLNVQIVNGLGATNGYAPDPSSVDPGLTATNGLGNLIVGYNEMRQFGFDNDRTGSHSLIVGREHNYTRFGSLGAGQRSTLTGAYSAVSGGQDNTASGDYASVGGGVQNFAIGQSAAVAGAAYSCAIGMFSTVSGGAYNVASGSYSSVGGGEKNVASGASSTVSGGSFNEASGTVSAVAGGLASEAAGFASSVSGGEDNLASGSSSTVSAGQSNVAGPDGLGNLGEYAAVAGGRENRAHGNWSVVGGGYQREATGAYDWVAGTLFEDQ